MLPENSIQPFSTQCNIVTSDRLASAVSVISKAFAPVNILARDKITDFESGLISDLTGRVTASEHLVGKPQEEASLTLSRLFPDDGQL